MRDRLARMIRLAALGGCMMLIGCAAKDPVEENVAWARAVKPLVEDNVILQQQRTYREEQDRMFEAQLNAAEERKIPYTDLVRYPSNWPEISELRDRRSGW